jgi:hypothetical protein
MSDPSNSNATPSNGNSPGDAAPVGAASGSDAPKHEKTPMADAAAGAVRDARAKVAARLAAAKAHPKVQQAFTAAKAHPLGAVATVAAAAALVEIEFAVGLLTGLGATALLASKSGPEARDEVIARGREAIARARVAIAKRKESLARKRAGSSSEAAAPPPAA